MQNGLAPNLFVMVEHWKKYLGCEGLSRGVRCPNPTPGSKVKFPVPGIEVATNSGYKKKTVGILSQHETVSKWKPRCPFKGTVGIFTHSQVIILGFGRGTTAQEHPETYRERTEFCGFRAWVRGTAAIIPVLSFSPVQPTGWQNLVCVEPYPNRQT